MLGIPNSEVIGLLDAHIHEAKIRVSRVIEVECARGLQGLEDSFPRVQKQS